MLGHVNINMTGPGRGEVLIDGQHIEDGVHGFTLTAKHGELNCLQLDVRVLTGEMNGEAFVHIPPGARDTLIALGWTPPPGLQLDPQ